MLRVLFTCTHRLDHSSHCGSMDSSAWFALPEIPYSRNSKLGRDGKLSESGLPFCFNLIGYSASSVYAVCFIAILGEEGLKQFARDCRGTQFA